MLPVAVLQLTMIHPRTCLLVGLVTLLLCLPCWLPVCTAGSANEGTTRLSRKRTFGERTVKLRTNSEPPDFTLEQPHWRELEENEGDFSAPDMSDIIGRPLIMGDSDSSGGGSAGSDEAVQGEGGEGGGGSNKRQRRIPEALLYPTCTGSSRELDSRSRVLLCGSGATAHLNGLLSPSTCNC